MSALSPHLGLLLAVLCFAAGGASAALGRPRAVWIAWLGAVVAAVALDVSDPLGARVQLGVVAALLGLAWAVVASPPGDPT
ncbi:MAG: hypothetical protein H6739_04030 [Alphaproteobacteria bacterium]|nr:hypothetical protein [Alphaproteobacteria bacterium]